MKCEHCKYFDPYYTEAEEGNCRRYPPAEIAEHDSVLYGAWPVVSSGDWCGEYVVNDTKVLVGAKNKDTVTAVPTINQPDQAHTAPQS